MPLLLPKDSELLDLVRRSGSLDKQEAFIAQAEIALAIQTPLREGILDGDIVQNIFSRMPLAPGSSPEFPLDLVSPGSESEMSAVTNPGHGRIPERTVESDYVMISTYGLMNSVDWLLRYAREARWDVVSRATQWLEAGFVEKMNRDGWHTILAAGVDRGILIHDNDAAAGQFTKRLVTLMKAIMKRNSGGNSASLNRGTLTDIYMSVEAQSEISNWGVDQLDDLSRREIYKSFDGEGVTRLFGVNLHPIVELGENQEYQDYFEDDLSGTYGPNSDTELVVGLDLSKDDSFIMPIKQEITVYSDELMHRKQRAGLYATSELGFGVLDTRRVLLGSF
jgi:hypothetical protein